jgi:hypothetical protein
MLLDIFMWGFIALAGFFIVFSIFGILDKGIDIFFRDDNRE